MPNEKESKIKIISIYLNVVVLFLSLLLGTAGTSHFLELALPADIATTFPALRLEQIHSMVTGDDHNSV